MTARNQPRQLFVTTALPYANGNFHIGHIMEQCFWGQVL